MRVWCWLFGHKAACSTILIVYCCRCHKVLGGRGGLAKAEDSVQKSAMPWRGVELPSHPIEPPVREEVVSERVSKALNGSAPPGPREPPRPKMWEVG